MLGVVWYIMKCIYSQCLGKLRLACSKNGNVLVLHTPIIKHIFEIIFWYNMYCRWERKYGRLKNSPSTVVVTLLYSTLLDNLPVKGSTLLDFLVFYLNSKFFKFQVFQYFSISIIFQVIFGASMQHQDTTQKICESLILQVHMYFLGIIYHKSYDNPGQHEWLQLIWISHN